MQSDSETIQVQPRSAEVAEQPQLAVVQHADVLPSLLNKLSHQMRHLCWHQLVCQQSCSEAYMRLKYWTSASTVVAACSESSYGLSRAMY